MGVSANSQVPQILSSRRALLLEDAHGLGQDMDANELLDLGSWEVESHGEMGVLTSQMGASYWDACGLLHRLKRSMYPRKQ